jgi:hypothetical protein
MSLKAGDFSAQLGVLVAHGGDQGAGGGEGLNQLGVLLPQFPDGVGVDQLMAHRGVFNIVK